MNITLYSAWIKYHEITGVRLACATGTVVNCFGSFLKTFLKTFAFIKLCNLSKENNGKYNGKYKGKYNGNITENIKENITENITENIKENIMENIMENITEKQTKNRSI